MNKKGLKTMAVSAVAGCLLLTFSIAAFATSGLGYEAYKDAVKATMLTENATVSTQFEVKDNGATILSGEGVRKLDKKDRSSKTSIAVDGVSKTFESSTANGNYIMSTDGKYYTVNTADKKVGRDNGERLSSSGSMVKLAELLTDTLVGDVKNQFVKDGQTISVKLEGAQIPELARLALSAAVENRNDREKFGNSDVRGHDESMKSLMNKMPKLSNIDVKSIAMTATVDGNTLKDNKLTAAIAGQDANGASHEITVTLTAKISDVGNTKIVSIDTTGKEVSTIDWTGKRHRR